MDPGAREQEAWVSLTSFLPSPLSQTKKKGERCEARQVSSAMLGAGPGKSSPVGSRCTCEPGGCSPLPSPLPFIPPVHTLPEP